MYSLKLYSSFPTGKFCDTYALYQRQPKGNEEFAAVSLFLSFYKFLELINRNRKPKTDYERIMYETIVEFIIIQVTVIHFYMRSDDLYSSFSLR